MSTNRPGSERFVQNFTQGMKNIHKRLSE